MKAPEKIYIRPMLDPSDGYVGVAWSDPYCDAKEYVRTDAFIEKAERWLKEIHRVCDITDENGYRIDWRELQARFEKYMEGE